MENNLFGVIIKVKNIDICRSFYRDVLELGYPVLDSNFWVEFKLPGNFIVILEKTDDVLKKKKSEHSDNISWFCHIDDVEKVRVNLRRYGYKLEERKIERTGLIFYSFKDPEDNPFYLACGSPNAATIKQSNRHFF